MRNNLIETMLDESPGTGTEVSHNLHGQRLGRKGYETRERILATAELMIESSRDSQITLSAIAREASVGLATFYLYFPDLGELILAVLGRVMDSSGAAYKDQLRTRWPEESLAACCKEFLHAHHRFWVRHSQLLQLRNGYADRGDLRFVDYQRSVYKPLIELLIPQMDGVIGPPDTPNGGMARILLIGFERLATIVTNPTFYYAIKQDGVTDAPGFVDLLLDTEAEVMALAIRRQRQKNAASVTPAG